jgi:hypothetical protein
VEAVAGDRDLMKALMKEALQEVLEGEMSEFLGAAPSPDISPAPAVGLWDYAERVDRDASGGNGSSFDQLSERWTNLPQPPKISMSGTHSFVAMETPRRWQR